ncbi:MAG: L,D-transpeptidase family protein, partial [Acidobacteria bacterium]|nr:L,D-transpeptidase family protein [Acidobacteriota bacterium]
MLPASSGSSVHSSSTEPEASIRALIDSGDPELALLTRAERLELHELYSIAGYSPLWVYATGRPDRNAREMLALLGAVADEGLDAADYRWAQLDRLVTLLESTSPASPADLARFDVAMSSGTLRYLRHLHRGRVDPRAIGFRLSVPADRHDYAAWLRGALATHRLADLAADLRPPLAQYQALRILLIQYRALAADTTLEPPPPSSTAVRPGEEYDGAGQLSRLLVAFGDLLPGSPPFLPDPARYNGLLVEGVRRFQVRHGLEEDGILGTRTLAALRTPLAWRVRQIELALERLRWLPHLGEQRLIALNIPMFRLWTWDAIPPTGAPLFGMDVIVGRALSTETPVFLEEMREVIFRPYWNVPRSILRNEILPRIERDPDYLRRENMEIVDGEGDNATPVNLTAESLARLRQGTLRMRQRPGPGNALGLIKFVFPNEENVYMHGTPAQALFARSRRDFSHGCVR